jgi:hypothetical protein
MPTAKPTNLPSFFPTSPPTGCVVVAGKLHVLFQKEGPVATSTTTTTAETTTVAQKESVASPKRRLLSTLLEPAEEDQLRTAVATALRIADPMALKMTTTTHHHNSTMHTVFEFHDLNAIALAHELELKVVSNQFNPLPQYPIHRIYVEEVFNCQHVQTDSKAAFTETRFPQGIPLANVGRRLLEAKEGAPLFSSQAMQAAAQDPPSCKNPWNVLQWPCNCHQKISMQCKGLEYISCYKDLLCNNPGVCPSWKYGGPEPNCPKALEAGFDSLTALLASEFNVSGHVFTC